MEKGGKAELAIEGERSKCAGDETETKQEHGLSAVEAGWQ